MTSVFSADGKNVPCTVIECGPCVVTQIKTVETDGYAAVQVGFQDVKEKNVSAPLLGHFKKAGVTPKRHLAEFVYDQELNLGDAVTVELFDEDDFVDVVGTSKGKGFQGAIHRHGLHRGPMAHGSKYHRHAGSNGACSDPSKVFKGKKMAGHMGHVKVTIQNLEVVRVDVEKNLILVKGAVPGAKKALVMLKNTTRTDK